MIILKFRPPDFKKSKKIKSKESNLRSPRKEKRRQGKVNLYITYASVGTPRPQREDMVKEILLYLDSLEVPSVVNVVVAATSKMFNRSVIGNFFFSAKYSIASSKLLHLTLLITSLFLVLVSKLYSSIINHFCNLIHAWCTHTSKLFINLFHIHYTYFLENDSFSCGAPRRLYLIL